MVKKFKFTLDLEVKISKEIEEKFNEDSSKFGMLVKEFMKDNEAILDLYKLWILGDLRFNEHYDEIEKQIVVRDENDILRAVLKKLPGNIENYFLEILEDEKRFEELEKVFAQFELLKLSRACFEEVK
jgi:hypothetical protein